MVRSGFPCIITGEFFNLADLNNFFNNTPLKPIDFSVASIRLFSNMKF